eukprot:GEMP01057629.1.p1 GENE.GEMP01057629.1~~GEMP01057629.1.p1  ORF type:complete len:261 (+),score=37.32 GEMP01057629.1:384-1166(+)
MTQRSRKALRPLRGKQVAIPPVVTPRQSSSRLVRTPEGAASWQDAHPPSGDFVDALEVAAGSSNCDEQPATTRNTKHTLTRCASAPARHSRNTIDEGGEETYFRFLRDDLKVDPTTHASSLLPIDPTTHASSLLPIDLRTHYNEFLNLGFAPLDSVKPHRATMFAAIFEGEDVDDDGIKVSGKNDHVAPLSAPPLQLSTPAPPLFRNQVTANRGSVERPVEDKDTDTAEPVIPCKDGDVEGQHDLSIEYFSMCAPHSARG